MRDRQVWDTNLSIKNLIGSIVPQCMMYLSVVSPTSNKSTNTTMSWIIFFHPLTYLLLNFIIERYLRTILHSDHNVLISTLISPNIWWMIDVWCHDKIKIRRHKYQISLICKWRLTSSLITLVLELELVIVFDYLIEELQECHIEKIQAKVMICRYEWILDMRK
jgi:hypothetical protein